MSKQETKANFGTINLTESFFNQMQELCLSEDHSDVAFIIGNERLPAHKIILITRSEYFRALLSGGLKESNQREIQLKEISPEPFKAVLRYIYTAQLCLSEMEEENILGIVAIADQYGFSELKLAISKYLNEVISLENVFAILESARLCNLKDLQESCLAFIDRNTSGVLTHQCLTQLSKESLQLVLHRDSFLAPEYDIFVAVKEWCEHNSNVNDDIISSCVRLPLINFDKHLKDLRQCGLLDSDKLLDVMEMRAASESLPYRAAPEANMVARRFGSKIKKGMYAHVTSFSSDISTHDLASAERRPIKGGCGEIVVELGVETKINYIEILLWEECAHSYSVEVSTNQFSWEKVVDFRDFHCKSYQRLHFPAKSVKYIKLEGSRNKELVIVHLEAMYTEIMPKPKIINGFTCSTVDLWGGNLQAQAPILNYSTDHPNHYAMEIVTHLDQPYYVGSLRLFLWNNPNYPYSCSIHVSADKRNWKAVASKSNDRTRSWQTISFPPIPISYIKIIKNSTSLYFSNERYEVHILNGNEITDK